MKKTRTSQRTRRLGIEGLESRAMLATVSAAGGLLFINGGLGPDNVTVTQTTTGQIQVDQVVGTTTTTATYPAVFGIYADLGAGADIITLGEPTRPLPLLTSVTLRLGDGSDTANLSVNIPGMVFIDGGMQFNGAAQNDIINVERSIIGSLTVNTYAGNDQLNIEESAILSLFANLGVASVGSGQVDYDLATFESSALGSAYLTLGGTGATTMLGNEVVASSTIFGLLTVNGGSGIDNISIDSFGDGIGAWIPDHIVNTAETLEPLLDSLLARLPIGSLLGNLDGLLERLPSLGGISLPGGIDIGDVLGFIGSIDLDTIDLSDTLEDLLDGVDLTFVGDISVIGSLNINTLGGADSVELEASGVLANATINTGAGTDVVILEGVNVPLSLFVFLGAGADTLELTEVSSAFAFLDGGSDFDTLQTLNITNLGRRLRSILSFESQVVVASV